MQKVTYKVCEHCKRIIAEMELPEALAPFGTVSEKRHNCLFCKIEKGEVNNI